MLSYMVLTYTYYRVKMLRMWAVGLYQLRQQEDLENHSMNSYLREL